MNLRHFTLHYISVINVLKEKKLLSFYKSLQSKRLVFSRRLKTGSGRSDFLRKLVPDRGGCDDEGTIT